MSVQSMVTVTLLTLNNVVETSTVSPSCPATFTYIPNEVVPTGIPFYPLFKCVLTHVTGVNLKIHFSM